MDKYKVWASNGKSNTPYRIYEASGSHGASNAIKMSLTDFPQSNYEGWFMDIERI